MPARLIAVLVVIGTAALVLGPTPGLTHPPGGRMRFDPDQFFDRMAQGGDSVAISSFQMGRDRAEEWARKNGITNGRMNRAQFRAYMDEAMSAMRRGFGGGGPERRDGPSDS